MFLAHVHLWSCTYQYYFSLLSAALLWTFMYKHLCGHMLSFPLGMSGIAGLYGRFIFYLWRNCRTVFPSGCIILYFPHILTNTDLCLSFCLFVPSVLYFSFLFSASLLATCLFFSEIHFDLALIFLSVILCVAFFRGCFRYCIIHT